MKASPCISDSNFATSRCFSTSFCCCSSIDESICASSVRSAASSRSSDIRCSRSSSVARRAASSRLARRAARLSCTAASALPLALSLPTDSTYSVSPRCTVRPSCAWLSITTPACGADTRRTPWSGDR
jgi:hypothetical protein